MMKFALSILGISIVFLATGTAVFASETPAFTSCLTPTGTILADYPNGDHGIAGIGSKNGHDTVYSVPQGVMQCFCGSDGAGTQTNWMSSSNLTADQIKVYVSQGWIAIPDGSAWGLTDGSYLAQNINYSCTGATTVSNAEGSTQGDGKSDGKSDGMGTSIVQAATGNSGLASTGNIIFVFSALLAGFLTTLFGLWLRKNTK